MTAPSLTVAIATLADRMHRVDIDQLPVIAGVDYHIFVQDTPVALPTHPRSDITLTGLDSHGVTISRNAAIAAASGEILLFADDDLVLATYNYAALRTWFADHPNQDFVCGQLQDALGAPFKSYGPDMARVTRLNSAKVGTPELAVRVQSVRDAGVTFDTDFGAGSANWLGDEYIFLCDALRAGLQGRHIALHLATHAAPSSGQDNSAASFAVREAVFRRALHPVSWPLRCAFAWRHRKRFPGWGSLFRFVRP